MPIKVAVFNNKGGVGKTTISIILTQIALIENKRVLGIDQDTQANYLVSLRYLENESRFKDLFTLKTVMNPEDLTGPYDWVIIDCAPGFTSETIEAIKKADIILMPIRPDIYSLLHFSKIMKEAGDYKYLFQFPLVKVGFVEGSVYDKSLTAKIISKIIEETSFGKKEEHYRVVGNLPIYETIRSNLSSGRKKWWSFGLQERTKQPFMLLYKALGLLYEEIQKKRKEDKPPVIWPDKPNYDDDPENYGI